MDREKLRVREEEHRDSEKDTGEEVETLRERKAKKTNPPPKKKKKNPKHQTRRKIINKISKQMNSGAQGRSRSGNQDPSSSILSQLGWGHQGTRSGRGGGTPGR